MESNNTCEEYVLARGKSEEKICAKPTVFGEKFCNSCVFRNGCYEQISEKLRSYRETFILIKHNDELFCSMRYGFVLKYNGELHLKGIFIEDKDDKYGGEKYFTRRIREVTDEEKKLAVSLGIKVDGECDKTVIRSPLKLSVTPCKDGLLHETNHNLILIYDNVSHILTCIGEIDNESKKVVDLTPEKIKICNEKGILIGESNKSLANAKVLGYEVKEVKNEDHMIMMSFILKTDIGTFTGERVNMHHHETEAHKLMREILKPGFGELLKKELISHYENL